MSESAPVLLLLFNRPDLGEQVFARVRQARPRCLFIAVDGARSDRSGEEALVARNRELAEAVDWPCEVSTLFRESNLGCGRAVSGAISWFFESVDSGIILEDDCLPDPSFFPFATELLRRYADEDRVMMINGTSYLSDEVRRGEEQSYYFSMFGHIWGWASWRRAWERYDYDLSRWPDDPRVKDRLRSFGFLPRWHINRNFALTKKGVINSWDYQWEHALYAHDGLAVTPMANLVSNIGFDERATHTSKGDDGRAWRDSVAVGFPLVHPETVEADSSFDRWYRKRHLMSTRMLVKGVARKTGKLFGCDWLERLRIYNAK